MEFSVKIEGLDKLAASTAKIRAVAEAELNTAAYAAAQHVATEYKRSILSGPKTGLLYKRRSVTHRASAPGEAPASNTGKLVNSIHVALEASLTSTVRALAKYALPLEIGTRFMAARPAMFPALEKSREWIKVRFAEGMRRAIEQK